MEPIAVILLSHGAALTWLTLDTSGFYYAYKNQVIPLLSYLFVFLMSGFIIGLALRGKSQKIFSSQSNAVFIIKYIGIKRLKIFFLVLCSIDCLFSSGVPAQIFLGIAAPTTTSYGVPLVQKKKKAMQLLLFTLFILNNEKKSIFFIFLLVVPILELSRASMVLYTIIFFSASIQNGNIIKFLNVRTIIFLLTILGLWLLIGNLRDTDALKSVVGTSSSIFRLWLYPYLVSPIVNLSETVRLGYISLPHSALNAITGWLPFYQKFGIVGLYLGTAIVGVLSGILFGKIRGALIPIKVIFTTGSVFLFFGIFLLNNAFLFLFLLLIICSKVKFKYT